MKRNLILAAAAVTAVFLAACGGKKEQKVPTTTHREVEKVQVLTLESERIAKTLELSATLEGYESMTISPSITGHIDHIYVEVGSRVKRGDTLVRMDQTQLNTTRINLATARTELERVKALKATGSASEQVYDQAKAAYDQLVETERFQAENTLVRARYAGVISAKNYEDGEMYTGAPILSLTQISRLKAIINIPETYFPLVRQGMKVTLESDIYPKETFNATIEIVYPTVDPASHTFQAKLNIPNASEKIRPGMYVRAHLAIGEIETIVVPYQSVLKLTGSNDRYVFVDDGGKARRVAVTMGQRFDDRIEIVPVEAGAIKAGDRLVTVGQARLVDGVTLEIVE
ncbi:MAG: efflux RND transporter periplasmic adaptor subunit [Bacteroidales bacterium]|nr:efflux RND transporter periplasmic adaptor subunit [Bacteroidales bacterium]